MDGAQLVAGWVKGMVTLLLDPLGLWDDSGTSGDLRSVVFTTTTPSTGPRTLEPVDDLHPAIGRSGHASEALPKGSIRFEPPRLAAGQDAFRLCVDAGTAAGRPGATYFGRVRVTDAASAGPGGSGIHSSGESVPVWIVLP